MTIKVLHVIDEHEVSGLVNVLCYQNNVIDKSDLGLEVEHCALHLSKDTYEYFRDWDIEIEPLIGLSGYKSLVTEAADTVISIKNFVKKVQRLEPDVIHAHAFPASILVSLSSIYLKNIPIVFTQHVIRHKANRIEKLFFNNIFSRFDYVTCVSENVREAWLNEFPQTENKVEVVYNGVPVDYFSPSYKDNSSIQIVMMSRLVDGRQFLPLLEGFAKAKFDNVELYIVGTGPREDELKRKTRELGIEDSTSFLGFVDDVRDVIKSKDIFLFPSGKFEGFGMSVIEAMSMGLPVVAIQHEVLTEIITNSKNGYLVQPCPEEVADRLSQVVTNLELLEKLSENARATVIDKFSIQKMNKEYLDVYKRLI